MTIVKHPTDRKEVALLFEEFKDVFPEKLPPRLPPQIAAKFHIDLEIEATTQKKGLYQMSPAELIELKNQLEKLLEFALIRPSSSPWGAPVLFVSKQDGALKMCIDHRASNRVTDTNSYALPMMDAIFYQLSDAKYFS